ncbi:MAG: LacI family DNA-binding transcriptional regulator [Candidatus Sumerlaeota bacterium]|nr:LacI family DNA-binding transcriptional regulator [Candidatus Sumerlaeota bacterium]
MGKNGIREIAQLVGVDPSTVSLALTGKVSRVSAKTRARILKAAEALDYRPNFMARALAGQKTGAVGLLVRTFQGQFHVDVVAAMERRLNEQGYSSVIAASHATCPEDDVRGAERLLDRFVDGLACIGVALTPPAQMAYASLAGKGTPLVMYGESLEPQLFEGVRMDRVVCLLGEASYEMTRYLLDLGHRRIAYIGSGETKIAGYRRALEEAGAPFDPRLVARLVYQLQNVREILAALLALDDPPTAIFAYTDDLAAELMRELWAVGKRVPDDVSIVGINDGWHSDVLRAPLTTIRLPAADIGRSMVEMLIERIENPALEGRVKLLDVELVKRESVAPPKGKGSKQSA